MGLRAQVKIGVELFFRGRCEQRPPKDTLQKKVLRFFGVE
jgi:hypothetical protein